MSDKQRNERHEGRAFPAVSHREVEVPEIVSLLGGPVFVDRRPGCVRVTCVGFTGVGPDRSAAFRALADQFNAATAS